jgi:hypothetical protein
MDADNAVMANAATTNDIFRLAAVMGMVTAVIGMVRLLPVVEIGCMRRPANATILLRPLPAPSFNDLVL